MRSKISIHAPRVGCDTRAVRPRCPRPCISIHAPRVGCDEAVGVRYLRVDNFNPRTPGGVRPLPTGVQPGGLDFNPRTPGGVRLALSRPAYNPEGWISIHAPRVGCDLVKGDIMTSESYFNPRTPGGVRQGTLFADSRDFKFQSTHPGWGATFTVFNYSFNIYNFNPRTPGGVRLASLTSLLNATDFNPRTPGGVRLTTSAGCIVLSSFQSTHPGWGATLYFYLVTLLL